jgi:hypothetical protein
MTAIKLKQSWKIWPKGHVISEMPDNQATLLIERGIAEAVPAEQVRRRGAGGMRAGRDYVTR